jgi:hypothetical protein
MIVSFFLRAPTQGANLTPLSPSLEGRGVAACGGVYPNERGESFLAPLPCQGGMVVRGRLR